jgi:hypothetical protein
MQVRSFVRYGALSLIGLILAGCGDGAEIARVSEEMKLNEDQQYAFKVCVRDLKEKAKPVFKVAGKDMKMTRVPFEVCGCQSKTLVQVFKDGKTVKASHPLFVSFSMKRNKVKFPKLDEATLAPGVKKEDGMKMLWSSFSACTAQYQSRFPKLSADLFKEMKPKKKPGEKPAVVKKPADGKTPADGKAAAAQSKPAASG